MAFAYTLGFCSPPSHTLPFLPAVPSEASGSACVQGLVSVPLGRAIVLETAALQSRKMGAALRKLEDNPWKNTGR